MEALLVGVEDEPPPGRFGRWMTDVLAERPWLNSRRTADDDAPALQLPADARR